MLMSIQHHFSKASGDLLTRSAGMSSSLKGFLYFIQLTYLSKSLKGLILCRMVLFSSIVRYIKTPLSVIKAISLCSFLLALNFSGSNFMQSGCLQKWWMVRSVWPFVVVFSVIGVGPVCLPV